jgi:hypothetical protein
VDLDPVDLGSKEAVRWLETLVWPEETDRLTRLGEAIAVARRDPPRVVRGDLLSHLGPLASEAPSDATLVVFHTAVLAYLTADERERFREGVMRLGGHWIAVEGSDALPWVDPPVQPSPHAEPHFAMSLDGGAPLAYCDPHGRWLQWIP